MMIRPTCQTLALALLGFAVCSQASGSLATLTQSVQISSIEASSETIWGSFRHTASNLIDGDLSTKWFGGATEAGQGSLFINLNDTHDIGSLRLTTTDGPASRIPKFVDVYRFDLTSGSWVLLERISTHSQGPNTAKTYALKATSTSNRFKLVIYVDGSDRPELAEVRLCSIDGCDVSTAPLARPDPVELLMPTSVIASSYTHWGQYNHNPNNVFDGDLSSKWFAGKNDTSPWLQFSFAESVLAQSFTMTSADDRPRRDPHSWTIYGSQNGFTWKALGSGQLSQFANRLTSQTLTFSNTDAFVHYRLALTARDPSERVQVSEVKLCGTSHCSQYTPKFTDESKALWFDRPGSSIRDAILLGNGPVGNMIYSNVVDERITFNLDSIWSGSPYPDSAYKSLDVQTVENLKEDVLSQSWTANATVNQQLIGRRVTRYLPASNLRIQQDLKGRISDYARVFDIDTATAETVYRINGRPYAQKHFVSMADNLSVTRISSQGDDAVTRKISMSTPNQLNSHTVEVSNGVGIIKLQSGTHASNVSGINLPGNVLQYTIETRVYVPDRVSMTASGNTLVIGETDDILIVSAIASNYVGPNDTSADANQRVATIFANADEQQLLGLGQYEALLARHTDAYSRYYNRQQIDFEGNVSVAEPIDVRLSKYPTRNDNDLLAYYVDYGRYLLIASAANGSLPPNLQGRWNNLMVPPWQSDYHFNVNLPMNYWLANQANLSDLNDGLFAYMRSLVPNGERTAKASYKVNKGWVAHHHSDAWGYTGIGSGISYGMWTGGALVMMPHVMEDYRFTGDTQKLAQNYAMLKGAADFFDAFLIDSQRIKPLSISASSHTHWNQFNHRPANVADGLSTTKWFAGAGDNTQSLYIEIPTAATVQSMTMITAEDQPGRDPKTIYIDQYNDTEQRWDRLDTVQVPTKARSSAFEHTFAKPWRGGRLRFTFATVDANARVQLSELALCRTPTCNLEDSELISPISSSPEQGPHRKSAIQAGPTMDTQLLHQLYQDLIESAIALGVDQDKLDHWRAIKSKLPAVAKISPSRGDIQEWYLDFAPADSKHRHISHLWGAAPGNTIDLDDSEIVDAIKKTLDTRGDISTGWGSAHRAMIWARLGDADRAISILEVLVSDELSYPNLFVNVADQAQIEGTFGITAVVLELLLQSERGELTVLPSLPAKLPNGSISGMRAHGGFEVDIAWTNGQLTQLEIKSLRGNTLNLRYGQHSTTLATDVGSTYRFDAQLNAI
ncbi:MAG: glycoside hydrolase N-terminal domain-containing protein [Gammaproteobacteria bacterium]|nr:glycoside hydrolase N-terminal domain-containing protein [Gammaproteobacteria bacterium]